ncbi:NUDIX domain-containing protein [Streptomyces globisporus]|uniref:NUDIX domain-containing protein n=1 Tax=Streptomyces globisporus TaxID=1908 RepID=UPI000691EB81|nr:NUDIX domain-containing protein [Streptomyces globisporus]
MNRTADLPEPEDVPGSARPPVEFLDARVPVFAEQATPVLSSWEEREVDRLWEDTTARNPATFDGPLVAVLGVDRPGDGSLVVRWAPMTYRYRALRRLRPPEQVPGSVFVTVLLPTEKGLVVGRGSPATAAPGRWSLPGGAVEPPLAGEPLNTAELRRHAARELVEEIGVRVAAEELRLWALTRSSRFGSLGFHFLCPPVSGAVVRRLHGDLSVVQARSGAGPELDEIGFVPSPAAAGRLGLTADYLPQLFDRYFTA